MDIHSIKNINALASPGIIQCEVQFVITPQDGNTPAVVTPWLPYGATDSDTEDQGKAVWAAIQAKTYGEITPYVTPVLSAEAQITINTNAIQNALDTVAKSRGYVDIKSACAYASPTSLVPSTDSHFDMCEKFRKEGNALQMWMAVTWASAYTYLATVTAGTNPMPTVTEAVALMPTFTWPD